MPIFIKIAAHERNQSGITSKGYWISKKVNTITVRWGAIKSINRKFYWAGRNLPQSRITTFDTMDKALWYYNDKLRRIRNQEYSLLPKGTKILTHKS